jgi:hypothetical protein
MPDSHDNSFSKKDSFTMAQVFDLNIVHILDTLKQNKAACQIYD